MAINAGWHQAKRMPKNATLQQRIDWHVAHQKRCGCREMPKTVRDTIARNVAKKRRVT